MRWQGAIAVALLVCALPLGPIPLFGQTATRAHSASPTNSPRDRIAAQCTLQAGPIHTVVRIVDAETVEVDDGTHVRLIGALPPLPPPFLPTGESWPMEVNARNALTELALGKRIELAYSGRRNDRWGRHLAHVFVLERGGAREWLQGALLRQGHARAYVLPENTDCFPELLAHEREAMREDMGLWRHPFYRIRWADTPQRLMRLRNSFELIEGQVVAVNVTRAKVYLNFGSDWRTDFTVAAPLNAAAFSQETVARLQKAQGARVRVRGWIERRNGPYIELWHPDQIEILDDAPLPASPGIAGHRPGGRIDSPAEAESPRLQDEQPVPQKKGRPEPEVPDALDL